MRRSLELAREELFSCRVFLEFINVDVTRQLQETLVAVSGRNVCRLDHADDRHSGCESLSPDDSNVSFKTFPLEAQKPTLQA